MRAWLYFFGDDIDAPAKEVLTSALLSRGIDAYPFDTHVTSGPGILFFSRFDKEVINFLRAACNAGVERVLAVGVNSSTIRSGHVWEMLQAGASDYVSWKSVDDACALVARLERWETVDRLVESPLVHNNLIGCSPVWIRVLRQIVEVARFTDASVLIMGESGTGKELVAPLIHTLDPRPQKADLVVLDCTTIVPELSGSEFFGHERGAFTGAVTARNGAFALANGGTLFLDEVGDLPLALQAQLLRVVQEHTYKRVGGNTWHRTEFRLVCATNKELLREVNRGKFRHDLYYRISGWILRLPPLRDRGGDVPLLVNHFLEKSLSSENGIELDDSVQEYFLKRKYAGNVRTLEQLVTRISQRHVGTGPITVGDIPEEERPSEKFELQEWCGEGFDHAIRRALAQGVGLKEITRAARETAIRIAIAEAKENLQRAARRLRVTDRALHMYRASRRLGTQLADQKA